MDADIITVEASYSDMELLRCFAIQCEASDSFQDIHMSRYLIPIS